MLRVCVQRFCGRGIVDRDDDCDMAIGSREEDTGHNNRAEVEATEQPA